MKKTLFLTVVLSCYVVGIAAEGISQAGSILRSNAAHEQGKGVEIVESEITEDTTLASFLEMELLHGDLKHILDEKTTTAPDISRADIADAISDFVESKLLIRRQRWQNILDEKKVPRNALLEVAALHSSYPRSTRSIKPKCLLYENYFFGQCAHGPPVTKLNDPSLGPPGT